MKTIIHWIQTHRYCLVLLYFIPYTLSYFLLGHYRTPVITVHSSLDDLIPFNEYFIIPYVLWYLYVGLTIVYLMFKDRSEFLHCTFFLFAGTTACLLIFLILPSQVDFRPEITGSNIFTHIIALIFAMDNPTNVCPSIHVYAALVTHIVLTRSKHIPKSPWINGASLLFAASVCLSTVFLKQHSIIDGFWAAVLCAILYVITYKTRLVDILTDMVRKGITKNKKLVSEKQTM